MLHSAAASVRTPFGEAGPIYCRIQQVAPLSAPRVRTGGGSNPLILIEQFTYLMFVRRLDDLRAAPERMAEDLGRPLARRILPEGVDDKGESCDNLRWSAPSHSRRVR
ncbi:hypothetical protein GCM10011415_14470 [Salipiger pallidus]|uniref:Uncharacterized protein n=1 Tax=Salipiger pallidus TaxID=1775170 RepID=A0A8J2ZIE6_9RHOB|nr:hypothetical protein [Salipiger pallidus]GGG68354.1 hypothetical protein GCM10011415_14470 [Salipiger pallidus]